jgi:hypothetical protein
VEIAAIDRLSGLYQRQYLQRWISGLAELEFDDAAAFGLFIKEIFFKIEETLIVFRVATFYFFIKKTSQSRFLGVSFNETVTQLAVL